MPAAIVDGFNEYWYNLEAEEGHELERILLITGRDGESVWRSPFQRTIFAHGMT